LRNGVLGKGHRVVEAGDQNATGSARSWKATSGSTPAVMLCCWKERLFCSDRRGRGEPVPYHLSATGCIGPGGGDAAGGTSALTREVNNQTRPSCFGAGKSRDRLKGDRSPLPASA
jgi:hypothetical protein